MVVFAIVLKKEIKFCKHSFRLEMFDFYGILKKISKCIEFRQIVRFFVRHTNKIVCFFQVFSIHFISCFSNHLLVLQTKAAFIRFISVQIVLFCYAQMQFFGHNFHFEIKLFMMKTEPV